MKVYELIEALSEAPAGAEICVAGYFTDSEIIDHTTDVEISTDNECLKKLEFDIEEAESENNLFSILIY